MCRPSHQAKGGAEERSACVKVECAADRQHQFDLSQPVVAPVNMAPRRGISRFVQRLVADA
jgi:hypothetical protein